jgi:hypothetical protein
MAALINPPYVSTTWHCGKLYCAAQLSFQFYPLAFVVQSCPMSLRRLVVIGFAALALSAAAAFVSYPYVRKSRPLTWAIVLAGAATTLGTLLFQYEETKRQSKALKRVRESIDTETERVERETHVGPAAAFGRGLSGLELVAKTSPANVAASTATTEFALSELRTQLANLARDVGERRNEIIEVQKIDPALQATLTTSIENLTHRIETLEKEQLERWDVVLVCIQLLGGLAVVAGLVKYALGK